MKPSTEQLKETLQELITIHNKSLKTQNECKEQIIAINAVIQDREDGNTNNNTSTDSEN